MCANNSRSGAKLLNISVPETVRESWCQGITSREYWLYFSDAWPGSNSSHGVTKVGVRMERRPRKGPRICYPGMLFLQLNFSSDSWVPVDNKNWNTESKYTFVVLIICVYVLASKDAIKRGVRVGIRVRSRNVDARETSCDRKYVIAALLGSGYRASCLYKEMHHSAIGWNSLYSNYGTLGLTRLCQRSYQWSVLRIN